MQKLLDFEVDKKDVSHREGLGISNLDGRLWNEIGKDIARYFGDEAMVRARIGIEARYLIALSQAGIIRKISKEEIHTLSTIHKRLDAKEYKKLRQIESVVRHDVIVMTEVFKNLLRSEKSLLDTLDAGWVHWGLSSEDVDNISRSILMKNFLIDLYIPKLKSMLFSIYKLSKLSKDIVIQGKTHLQPAVPTLLGKEIAIFGVRLAKILEKLENIEIKAKMGGAVGNFSAQKSVFPKINWIKFGSDFIKSFGLSPNPFVTQIENKDGLVELLGFIQQINSILVDFSQDMRIYIGMGWFTQTALKVEAGSSAMPQKINPIDFENSQGNAQLSNWIIAGLRQSLPVSWLQRDLTDKTIQRNLGLPFGYSLISVISCEKGVERASPNKERIKKDLYNSPEILSEAYQVNLRAMGKPNGYEELRKLSRGKQVTWEDIKVWVEKLDITKEQKDKLKNITPESYIGEAKKNLSKMMKIIHLCSTSKG